MQQVSEKETHAIENMQHTENNIQNIKGDDDGSQETKAEEIITLKTKRCSTRPLDSASREMDKDLPQILEYEDGSIEQETYTSADSQDKGIVCKELAQSISSGSECMSIDMSKSSQTTDSLKSSKANVEKTEDPKERIPFENVNYVDKDNLERTLTDSDDGCNYTKFMVSNPCKTPIVIKDEDDSSMKKNFSQDKSILQVKEDEMNIGEGEKSNLAQPEEEKHKLGTTSQIPQNANETLKHCTVIAHEETSFSDIQNNVMKKKHPDKKMTLKFQDQNIRNTFPMASEVKSKKNKTPLHMSKQSLKSCLKFTKGRIIVIIICKIPSKKRKEVKNFLKYLVNKNGSLELSVAREIHMNVKQRPILVFVLGTHFDRLSNGTPPPIEERMHHEYFRISTFSKYTGNGISINLAKNGFFHDLSEGPSSTRCFMCDARNSDWERDDNVEAEHRRQSPNCPFLASRGQESVIEQIDTSTFSTVTSVSTSTFNEATEAIQRSQINNSSGRESISQQPTEDPESRDRSLLAFSQPRQLLSLGNPYSTIIAPRTNNVGCNLSRNTGESIPQQPTEDPESRDHSLLAFSQPQQLRALGNSNSTIIALRRNNVANSARSNIGIDTSTNGSSTSGTASQLPGRPSALSAGPVCAGSNNGQQVPVSTSTESSQQSNVPSPAVEAAGGAGSGAGGRTDPTITVVVDNPKHPDYLNIETRVNSYHGWPDYLDQTARQMSEAGFFYVGVADCTRCFCCGAGVRNWGTGDDPMLEHTRWFPHCEYVNKLKGERYVAAVQRHHTEHMAEQQRQQQELAQRRDENRNPPDPMTKDAAAVMREMGYSIERTREAILAVRQQTGSVDVTTQQVLTWLLDEEKRQIHIDTSNTDAKSLKKEKEKL